MKDLDDIVDAAATDLAEAMRRDLLAPDFAAVVAEAHARDPKRVPAAALVEVRELAPVAQLRRDASGKVPAREQAEFAALLAAARAEIDQDCAAVRAAGPPPLPVPRARQAGSRGWMWLAAAAAVAALAFGVRPLLTRGQGGPDTAIQAPFQDEASPSRHEVAPAPAPTRVERVRPGAGPTATASEAEVPAEVALPVEVAPQAEDVPRDMPEKSGVKESAEKGRRGRGARRRRSGCGGSTARPRRSGRRATWPGPRRCTGRSSRWPRARARPIWPTATCSRWPASATAAMRRSRCGGRICRRSRAGATPTTRAGLCRRADEGQRASCWRDYVTDFPNGVHRHQATRVLEGEP
ncbi:hypothetical protein [Nannocystis pusilla]|uniref:hypothetical protein n=1 Tax=Nannocystis pusilla TaxID=889268 RepID=UPI003B807A61